MVSLARDCLFRECKSNKMQIVSRHIFMAVDFLDPVYTEPDKFFNGQKHAQIFHLSTTVIIFCWFCICCPSLTGHNAINISKIPLVFSVFKEITFTVNVNLYHVTRALHVTKVFLKLDCRSLFTTSTKN